MQAVWDGAPVTARDVHDRLLAETGWAYTTVKTLLTRLAEKGVLAVRREAGASVYDPLLDRDAAQRSAVRALLAQAFGGALSPMMRFLADESELSDRDRKTLELLLEKAESDDAEPTT